MPGHFKNRYTKDEWGAAVAYASYNPVTTALATSTRQMFQETVGHISSAKGRHACLKALRPFEYGWIDDQMHGLRESVWSADRFATTRSWLQPSVPAAPKTPADAQRLLDEITVPRVTRIRQDAAILADPTLYAPTTDPQKVVERLGQVADGRKVAQHIFDIVHGVYLPHRQGRADDARRPTIEAVMEGEITVAGARQVHIEQDAKSTDGYTSFNRSYRQEANQIYRALHAYATGREGEDLHAPTLSRLLRRLPGVHRAGTHERYGSYEVQHTAGCYSGRNFREFLAKIADAGNGLAAYYDLRSKRHTLHPGMSEREAFLPEPVDRLPPTDGGPGQYALLDPVRELARAQPDVTQFQRDAEPYHRRIPGMATMMSVELGRYPSPAVDPTVRWHAEQRRDPVAEDAAHVRETMTEQLVDALKRVAPLYGSSEEFTRLVGSEFNDRLTPPPGLSIPQAVAGDGAATLATLWEQERPEDAAARERAIEGARHHGYVRPAQLPRPVLGSPTEGAAVARR